MTVQLLVFCFTLSCLVGTAAAFGAGNIPSYGALEGIAFRHGDIEDILLQLAMSPAGSGTGGFLSNFNPLSSAGKKFNAMAVKRVYFGNWLRDYSQAVDVGTLSKGLDAKAIRLLVWVMGFMAFGYATEEFEVTDARLGVYRPEEHIDNPKGYPNPEEPDARKFDSRLRGPVDAVELQIDPESGMKNYIANERGFWMTSSSYVRNSLLRCIELGRGYKQSGDEIAKFESLRVLGQALHTLEDFSAHSNYCELALIELGYHDVFPQVGISTSIRLQNGKTVYPLTTGTFGGLDFVHSLLGEATDKISQTQITEVTSGLASSSSQGSVSLLSSLQRLSSGLPGFTLPREMDQMQAISREADSVRAASSDRFNYTNSVNTDADEIARKIYPIMAFRDRVVKGISAFFEKIPGLSALIDQITEALTVWVLSTIEPFMKPIVEQVTAGLGAGQSLVTSKEDQLEVFDNPRSSDPTHSMLAKDHFSCYLNHPAGLIGQAVVRHAVTRVTTAWVDHQIDPNQIISEILEVFHHPASPKGRTGIQHEMRSIVENWANGLGSKRAKVFQGLSFDGVKQGLHHEGGSSATTGASSAHVGCHSNSDNRPPKMGQHRQDFNENPYSSYDSSHSRKPKLQADFQNESMQPPQPWSSETGSHRQSHEGAASSYYGSQQPTRGSVVDENSDIMHTAQSRFRTHSNNTNTYNQTSFQSETPYAEQASSEYGVRAEAFNTQSGYSAQYGGTADRAEQYDQWSRNDPSQPYDNGYAQGHRDDDEPYGRRY